MLGGINTPKVPPAAIHPVANLAEYPLFLISGMPIVPIAAQVAGLPLLRGKRSTGNDRKIMMMSMISYTL